MSAVLQALDDEVALVFAYCRGVSKFDNSPVLRTAPTFEAFRDAVLADRSRFKGAQFICAPMRGEGGALHRGADDALPRAFQPFDLDKAAPNLEAVAALNLFLCRFQGFGWFTHSHRPESPRLRVILALSREVTRDEGKIIGLTLEAAMRKAVTGLGKFDRSVYRGEQPVYCPPVGAETFLFEGEPVDVDEWLAGELPDDVVDADEGPGVSERAETIASTDPVVQTLLAREMVHKEIAPGKLAVVCPFDDEHTSTTGDTSTVYFLPHFAGVKYGKFHCLHDHCEGRTQEAFIEALGLVPRDVWRAQNADDARSASAPRFAAPLDVFAYHDAPPLPLDCLPGVIRDFAADRAELIGCDPAAIALPALVICGAALPDSIQIQPKAHDRTWRESARLWAAVIGNPSSKKSPGLKAAAGPAFNINAKLAEANARTMAEYEEALAAHKKAKNDGPPPVRPPWLQLIVQDTTIEALADALLDNPRGVIAIQDELSEWIGSMDAYTSKGTQKDRPAWLQAFEGGPRSLNRVMRGRAVIPNWSTAIVGGIQPDVVRRLMGGNGTGDGLLQRFLVAGLAPAGPGVDREPDEAAAAAYRELVRHLFEIREEDAVVTLAPVAASVWRDYMRAIHGVADALSGGQEQFATHLGKWPGILARLLLVYHVIECAGSRQYPGAVAVSLASAEAVIGLARRYLLPHAASFYGTVLNERSHHQTAAKVADVILVRAWQSFTSRDLAAHWKGWRGFDERYQAAVLTYLEMCNWITPSEPQAKAGRRPSDLWLVNPETHQRFSELAERERERRARLRADWHAAGQA